MAEGEETDAPDLTEQPEAEAAAQTVAQAPADPRPRHNLCRPDWFRLVCAVCVLAGLACRFVGLNWDEGALLHPDERFMAGLVFKIGLPASWSGWWNSATSVFNPDNLPDTHYVYGQLPLLLGKIVAAATGCTRDRQFLTQGRALSGCFDAGTVLLTFCLVRRLLCSNMAAPAAAALVAGAALHIQSSHFYTADSFATFFLTGLLVAGVRWTQSYRVADAVVMGACLGAAMACKASAVFGVVALLGFGLCCGYSAGWRQSLPAQLAVVLAAFWVFRGLHPMAFRGELLAGVLDIRLDPRFLSDMRAQAAITSGQADVPFNVQWIGRANWLYPMDNLAGWAYGWPMALCASCGVLRAGWQAVRRPGTVTPALLACLVFGLVLLGIQGAQFSKFTRYYLPLTPVAALAAAFFLQDLARRRPRQAPLFYMVAAAVMVLTTVWGMAVTSIYTREHTRLAATRWMWSHLPPGTIVANETDWDDALPLAWLARSDGYVHPDGLRRLNLDLYGPDTALRRQVLLGNLDAAQWLVLSSPRQWTSIPRWNQRWPGTAEYYRLLFGGQLGFVPAAEWVSFPTIGPWRVDDSGYEEALSVYDHPRVLLFQKTAAWSYERARRLLEQVPLPPEQPWVPASSSLAGFPPALPLQIAPIPTPPR